VYAAYAVAAPGLETLTAAELRTLGLDPTPGLGGVSFEADAAGLVRANVHLRTASRVLVRLLEFTARDFAALEKHARRIPWNRFTKAGHAVRFRVTCKKSRLYHQRAVAERLGLAAREAGRIVEEGSTQPVGSGLPQPASGHLEGASSPIPSDYETPDPESALAHRGPAPVQTLSVRLFRDRCTVSVDASGEHLHRRGYRLRTAKAPMRENLAAAVLLAVGWDPASPLVDPMCGSGTLLIEAAMLARGIPPGFHRTFAFQGWPEIDPSVLETCRAEAAAGVRSPVPAVIVGSDRDTGAVAAAGENAARAGVADDVRLFHRALSAAAPPSGTESGWVVTNPPFGRRVGARDRLRDLYAALGNLARQRFAGWDLAVVCPDRALVGQLGMPMEPCLTTRHGGLQVQVWRGLVPGG
jgi:putative N6-adenine-specific DNA methylase